MSTGWTKKRIVLIDDHLSIREMLVSILSRDVRYEVAGQTGSGLEAVRLCLDIRPDLVILDLVLPELSGPEVLRRLHQRLPSTKVLIYTGTQNHDLILDVLKCRPSAFVEKSESLKTLREAIDAACAGSNYFTPFASGLLYAALSSGARPCPCPLSAREREVLQMVAEGLSTKEISSHLKVAVKTVENHRANLMTKLHLHDVASLTRYAVKQGIVSVE